VVMRNRKTLVLVGLSVALALVLGTVGVAFAVTDPAVAPCGIGMGTAVRDAGIRLVDILADLTGLSTTEIAAERAEGASIADVAEANGVAADEVLAAALAARAELLDGLVADGTITQDQADLMYEQMTDRLSERITSTTIGRAGWGGGAGCALGTGTATGAGQGTLGQGNGYRGQGRMGMGLRDGSCLNQ